jgi:hypothetical protein
MNVDSHSNLPRQAPPQPPFGAVLLPSALPDLLWIEYLRKASFTVIDDLASFSRKSYVHRGLVRTPRSTQWIYIPVHPDDRKSKVPMCAARIDPSADWRTDFWKSLEYNYRNSIWFDHYEFYLRRDIDVIAGMHLYTDAVRYLFDRVLGYLEIQDLIPEPYWLSQLVDGEGNVVKGIEKKATPMEKLRARLETDIDAGSFYANKCTEAAKLYPNILKSAASALGELHFGTAHAFGIVFEYDSLNFQIRGPLAPQETHQSISYPVYRQHFGGFEPGCCLLDLLFEEGPECWRMFC